MSELKTCIYCAEDIRQEAIICRYCTRPVLTGAKKVVYLGPTYALGRTDSEHWGIWNMITGGDPVEKFGGTNEAWGAAWKRYQVLNKPPSGGGTWMVGGFIPLDW